MAKSLNQVELLGYLGADVELRYTPQGTAVGNVNIATTRGVKRGDDWEDETEWTPLVIWDKGAENLTKYAHKGSRVWIKGRLQTRNWEDKETGQKRYKTEVVVEDFILLDSRSGDNTDSPASAPQKPASKPTAPAKPAARNTPQPIEDDSLPF